MKKQIKQAQELISRLERVSVDSYWAHRASGCRVAILRFVDRIGGKEWDMDISQTATMDALLEEGYLILENAAKDLRGR